MKLGHPFGVPYSQISIPKMVRVEFPRVVIRSSATQFTRYADNKVMIKAVPNLHNGLKSQIKTIKSLSGEFPVTNRL